MSNIKEQIKSLAIINKDNKKEWKQLQREHKANWMKRTKVSNSKIETTLLHIIYLRTRNKIYQHTKDDNVYVESHKAIYERILLRCNLLENNQKSESACHAS